MKEIKCKKCENEKNKKNKIVIAIVIVLIIIVVIGALTLFYKSSNNTEKYAAECINIYKSKLTNKDSLQIHDIRWQENELVEDMIFIYIDNSADNNRSIIRCGVKNNNVDYQGSNKETDELLEKVISEKINEGWKSINNKNEYSISVEQVMKDVNAK